MGIANHKRFGRIDGSHPFRERVPDGYVDYAARRIPGTEVLYFNFALAREMGLLPPGHPNRLDRSLESAILDAFAIQIVNEYDLDRGLVVPDEQRVSGRFMATRYLQLQHPGRTGKQSGDGRSLWNGTFRGRGVTWDLMSNGTGVTRLCPATAETGEFFRTANVHADYGCGTAALQEGLETLLMGEVFHRSGLATERVLAILRRPDGFAINVRAGRNLIRPSHFFVHLKQGNLDSLRGVADLFLERQVQNGDYPQLRGRAARYDLLADRIARTFGALAATFEREYIFCWLDWDGDNILADGGIIDYGSVRQFGLYHREYRFDDGPRWSTTIAEQRRKAREIVRTFAQVRDFLIEGVKRPLRSYRRDPVLETFDAAYTETRDRLLLRNIGLSEGQQAGLLERRPDLVRRFDRVHTHFEHAQSARGPLKVSDGISWNAIFSTRDLLRELPLHFLESDDRMTPRELIDLAASNYASRRDRRLAPYRVRMASEFQRAWLALVEDAARAEGRPVALVIGDVAERSATINRYARITGDAISYAAGRLTRERGRLGREGLRAVIERFVGEQATPPPGAPDAPRHPVRCPNARRIFDGLLEAVEEMRHGL
jgi:uncharacterized protein YdiU (UPF0061 family)